MALKEISPEELVAKGVVSAPDTLEGSPRENKLIFDRMAAELLAPAHNAAVRMVNEMETQREGWDAAEADRKSSETTRVGNEETRAAAETGRQEAESSRVLAETARAEAEGLRVQAEAARAEAERTRDTAEQQRLSSETGRQKAEESRVTVEQGRVTAEGRRAAAEGTRASAETTRGLAEEARIQAEAGRAEAESGRATAEQSRQTAEANRERLETGYVAQAKGHASTAESWAVGGTGTRPGEDTDNARYWAGEAQKAAGGGVATFNGRDGSVLPQKGDYSVEMIKGAAAAADLKTHEEKDTHLNPGEREDWNGKQRKITGKKGQVVMINAAGEAEAQDAKFGASAQILVRAEAGVTVTITGGAAPFEAVSTGKAIQHDVEYGTYTVTGRKPDGATSSPITVKVDQVRQYEVEVVFISKVLAENDWATIRDVSDKGQGKLYWEVGDTKPVLLNGNVGSYCSLDNKTVDAFIVDFASAYILFQLGKIGGTLVGLLDSKYSPDNGWNPGGSGSMCMNTSNTNSGGWKNSYMRNTILDGGGDPKAPKANSYLSVLPPALRNVMKKIGIWSDNTGGGSDTASYVTETQDCLFLPAEFEVFGSRSNANSAEQQHQHQFAYYKAGNPKKTFSFKELAKAVYAWLRSVYASNSSNFCNVGGNGTPNSDYAHDSLALSPCFPV